MKQFHITYYLKDRETPTLTGLTVIAKTIIGAIQLAKDEGVNFKDIKYIIEL